MHKRFSQELLHTLSSLPKLDNYQNSTTVLEVAGEALRPQAVLTASCAGGLPLLLVSGTGDAKSMMVSDLVQSYFGGRGTFLRGDGGDSPLKAFLRNDFRALFARQAPNDEALVEPTERLRYPLLFADELNRQLLTAMQSDLLQLLDGKITHRGRELRLGTERGFLTVIAAMNVGPAYVATSQLDEAVRQRFPMVLDLDAFAATSADLARVQPYVQPAPQSWLTELEAARAELTAPRPLPTGLRLASTFVAHHLNRCSLLDRPKRTLTQAIPRLCADKACPHMNRGCHHLDETPWRILLSLERVTVALQAVATAGAHRAGRRPKASIDGDVHDYLNVLQVFGWPVSSVLLTKAEDERSAHDYAREIVAHVRESFERHKRAVLAAVTGWREGADELGPWQPVVDALLAANQELAVRRLWAVS